MHRLSLLLSLFFILGCQKQLIISSELGIPEAALIIGPDDRKEINNHSDLSKMVGQITVRQAQTPGSHSTCTATLIAKNYLITAAHCVFHPEKGGLPETVLFTPNTYRQKKDRQDLYFVEKVYLLKEHLNLRAKDSVFKDYMVASDVAVLKLAELPESQSAGEVYGFLEISPTQQSNDITIISYPGDKPQGTQWIESKCALRPHQKFMSVDCDLIIGASGGALIADAVTKPQIRGVVSGETATHNLSAVLTEPIVNAVQTIAKQESQNLFEEFEIYAQPYHRLFVFNDCDQALYVGVQWRNLEGEMQIDGFHILQAGQVFLAAEMTSNEYAIYATNPERTFELKGSTVLDIGGMPVEAIQQKISGAWQDVNYRFNCRSAESIR